MNSLVHPSKIDEYVSTMFGRYGYGRLEKVLQPQYGDWVYLNKSVNSATLYLDDKSYIKKFYIMEFFGGKKLERHYFCGSMANKYVDWYHNVLKPCINKPKYRLREKWMINVFETESNKVKILQSTSDLYEKISHILSKTLNPKLIIVLNSDGHYKREYDARCLPSCKAEADHCIGELNANRFCLDTFLDIQYEKTENGISSIINTIKKNCFLSSKDEEFLFYKPEK